MISHHKVSAIRHLIGEFDIAVSQRLLYQIGFVQGFAVHCDISLLIDIYPASGTCDHSLHQNLIIIVESDHISLGEICTFHRYHDLTFLNSGIHGISIYLQYRK